MFFYHRFISLQEKKLYLINLLFLFIKLNSVTANDSHEFFEKRISFFRKILINLITK